MNEKQEKELFELAKVILRKNPILREQSSACRRAWCEGFVNGKMYFDHLKPKKAGFFGKLFRRK